MSTAIPFDHSLFWCAMIGLLGREPDDRVNQRMNGYHSFRYKPKDATENKKFIDSIKMLKGWLSNFDLVPLESRCEYGPLTCPQEHEVGKNYLDICIVYPVKKSED